MAFFKKKETKKEEDKTSPKKQEHTSLLEIPYGRVLTAEGWKRRLAQKTPTKSKKSD